MVAQRRFRVAYGSFAPIIDSDVEANNEQRDSRMKLHISMGLRWAVLVAAATMIAACGSKNDAVTQTGKADTTAGVPAPTIEEIKTVAEEGFIYGLAPVMYYQIMYEYSVDANSGRYKAPFNKIKNESRVYTYKTLRSSPPTATRPVVAFSDLVQSPSFYSVPAVEKTRYCSVMYATGKCQFWLHRAALPATRRGTTWSWVLTGRAKPPPGIKQDLRSQRQFSLAAYRTQLFNAGDMPMFVKVQAAYKVQPLSAYLHQPAPAAAPAINFPQDRQGNGQDGIFRLLRFSSSVRSCRA